MKSYLTEDFIRCFNSLPKQIQHIARKNYNIWKNNPHRTSFQFKRIGQKNPIYSVRIGIGWRALGVLKDQDIIWFWIGSHADYEKLIKASR